MVAENLLREIFALPAVDRVELYERLHENLHRDPAAAAIPQWQVDEIARRVADDDANPNEGYSLEEVKAMLAEAASPASPKK